MKYMNDSGDGAEQYHRGYVTALEIVAEFLDRQESGRALHRTLHSRLALEQTSSISANGFAPRSTNAAPTSPTPGRPLPESHD
jgi:hypothetical protein